MNVLNQKYFFVRKGIATLFFCAMLLGSIAQKNATKGKDHNRFVAYPVGYYSPETRSGVGFASTLNFRTNSRDSISPSSQISLGAGITQNNQAAISLPFALYFNNRRHTINGEVTYNRFSYEFYGTGSGNFRGDFSMYEAEFPLFRINYLYRLSENWFVGPRWWYEDYRILSVEKSSAVNTDVSGMEGGITSGPGFVCLFDARDNIYYSSDGNYLELSWQTQSALTGSSFYYDRIRFDYRNFYAIGEKTIFASNLFGDFTNGNVPFSQLPGMGSSKRARGYYQGRFRDKNLLLYQGEIRRKIDLRWGMTAFWNYGLLSDRVGNFNFKNDHAAVGFGFRYSFDQHNKTNLRLDLAWPFLSGDYVYQPDKAMKIYFTVNEAF
jgi:hypothetical protein